MSNKVPNGIKKINSVNNNKDIKKVPNSSQSEPSFLLKSKYYKLLKIFIQNPNIDLYVNQIKKETGLSPRIVVNELKELEKRGFLISEKKANALFYRINPDNIIIEELKRLFFNVQ